MRVTFDCAAQCCPWYGPDSSLLDVATAGEIPTITACGGNGLCSTCRFFRERGRDDDAQGPHLCMLFEEPLSPDDRAKICISHEAGG